MSRGQVWQQSVPIWLMVVFVVVLLMVWFAFGEEIRGLLGRTMAAVSGGFF